MNGLHSELALPAGRDELIGGDFHDVIVRPDGLVVALIGDVTGKGMEAAGFTETVRAPVRTLALISSSPGYILDTGEPHPWAWLQARGLNVTRT